MKKTTFSFVTIFTTNVSTTSIIAVRLQIPSKFTQSHNNFPFFQIHISLFMQFLPSTALNRSVVDISGISSIPPSRHASRDETSRTSSFAFEAPFNSVRHQHIQKYHQVSGFTSSASTASALTNGNVVSLQEQVGFCL